jgi:hypothetical protein
MDLTKRSGEPILEADFYFFCQSTDYSMSSMATGDPIGIESAESGHLTGGLVQGLIFSYWRVLNSRNIWNKYRLRVLCRSGNTCSP